MSEDRERAHLYLASVAERPSAALWDLVDEVGAVDAADAIRSGSAPRTVTAQTRARAAELCVDEVLDRTTRAGARFLHPDSPDWPGFALAALDLPRRNARGAGRAPDQGMALRPFGLWWRGPAGVAEVTAAAAGVVGTRAPSSYGRSMAAEIGGTCAVSGLAVVSGGAFGIDAAAHRGALRSDGITVAVLAGGVDRPYPRGNSGLLAEVAERGAVISAQPPGTTVARYRFLDRNRLIAALSSATVVVEAAVRSGALSTAGWARGMGRPVGAVPGPITSVTSLGCHEWIKGERAVLVASPAEVVELAGRMGSLAPVPDRPTTEWDGLDDESRRVLEAVPPRGGAAAAGIAVDSGVEPARTRIALGRLLAEGRVERTAEGWRRRRDPGTQLSLPVASV